MLHRTSLPAAAVMAFAAAASSQVSTLYTFTQSTGVYTPITGGTILGTATGATGAAALDDISWAVTLPFAVQFELATHTQVQVQTNGHIAFSAVPIANTFTPLSVFFPIPGFVAACASDLQGGYTFASTSVTGTNTLTNVSAVGPLQVGDAITRTGVPAGTTITAIAGNTITMSANATASSTGLVTTCVGPWSEVRWETVGTAPSREVVFQWSNFQRYGAGLTVNNGTRLNFQIRLHENGEIRCVYGDCSPGTAGVTSTAVHQVGLRGPNNTFPTNVNNRANTKGVNDDWSLSAAGTSGAQGMLCNTTAPANVIPNGLTYLWAPPAGTLATNTTIGAGCGSSYNSFYQLFADAAVASAALQGNALELIATAGGYVGNWIPGGATAFVTPVAPTVLATDDDGEVDVTPSVPLPTPYGPQATLRVTGNGIIGFGNVPMTFPNSFPYWPMAQAFLEGNLGGFYCWHDFNEVEGGDIQSEEIGGVLYITYHNVESFPTGTVNPGTLQFQLELATGNAKIVWVAIDTDTASGPFLVGVTAPGLSLDGGSLPLATSTLVTAMGPEGPSGALIALNRPIQGAGPQNWNLTASNLPVGIGVDIIGLADPGITDLSLFGLGQVGCQLRATLDFTAVFVSGGYHPWSGSIPGGAPALSGVEVFAQSAVLGRASLSQTLTTNGVKGKIGTY